MVDYNGLSILYNINSNFASFGVSAIDDSNGVDHGKPNEKMEVPKIRKSCQKFAAFHNFKMIHVLLLLCINHLCFYYSY